MAALFFTLIATANVPGVSPEQYRRVAAPRAIATPGAVILPRELLAG